MLLATVKTAKLQNASKHDISLSNINVLLKKTSSASHEGI